jgi:hypothetical protein
LRVTMTFGLRAAMGDLKRGRERFGGRARLDGNL